ncbi:MAG: SDR family NAD(P)-dependent oxidoreductase, partial [Clostridiales bacterium]|nr:SDR family NAD(P)-dependent oxidoreductase [Clostridiales bacterium]
MTVLVTGSSRGIGRAIALKFSESGADVVLNCAHDTALLEETLSDCRRHNPNAMAVRADVSDYDAVKGLFAQIENRFGGVDVLVNNAGIAQAAVGLFTDMQPDELERLLSVNTKSVFNCCHFAVPGMVRKKDGCIINISSIWGVSGASCEAVYSATKGAVNAFTKALGKELAPSGVRVNAIACGV